jgi:hypothetical protein
VSTTVCPKCGLQQEAGEECKRCGVIFGRIHPEGQPLSPRQPEGGDFRPVSLVRRIYRISSWLSIACLMVALVLILRPSSPPGITVTPEAIQQADAKVREFETSLQRAEAATLEMDESELNGWLGANLAIPQVSGDPPSGPSASPVRREASPGERAETPSLEQVQSSVREVKISLLEDGLRAYVLFEIYGKSLSLELEGRLMIQDGCLRLEPTSGRLGSLPLTSGTLRSAAQRLFDSPENREKFRVPAHIKAVTVEQGRLIVSSR